VRDSTRERLDTSLRPQVIGLVVVLAVLTTLAAPSPARAARPNIERVFVSAGDDGRLRFRIAFAAPVALDPDDTVQVAIDADRDYATGVDGLEYSLDWTGSVALLTAVDGEQVESHPSSLRFTRTGTSAGSSAVTFSIRAAAIGSPPRFDFYVFIEKDGDLDEAPSHVVFSAGSKPWTYPKHDEAARDAYPPETYVDGSDFTLSERGLVFVAAVGGVLLGIGAIVAAIGVSVQRSRGRRKGAPPPTGEAA
jgi:hypothetical protein